MEQLRIILEGDFTERQNRNANFSMRSYAKFLGISVTSLNMFLNGKRGLSKRTAETVLQKIGFKNMSLLSGSEKKPDMHELNLDQLSIISDWYFFAILSLMETNAYKHNPTWIAKRLGITREVANAALKTLENEKMIIRDKHGSYKPSKRNFSTPTEVSSYAIRKSHIQALDLAKFSLEHDDISKRNFTAMTLVTSPEKLAEAKRRINNFSVKLAKFLESGEKKEIYRLSLQLFPLSRS